MQEKQGKQWQSLISVTRAVEAESECKITRTRDKGENEGPGAGAVEGEDQHEGNDEGISENKARGLDACFKAIVSILKRLHSQLDGGSTDAVRD